MLVGYDVTHPTGFVKKKPEASEASPDPDCGLASKVQRMSLGSDRSDKGHGKKPAAEDNDKEEA